MLYERHDNIFPSKVKIVAFPRIHISLIGMNNRGYRINGGAGFSIKDPKIEINVERCSHFKISDKRGEPLSEDGISRLTSTIQNQVIKHHLTNNISISISGRMPSNSGFGSGTIIRLASLEALFILNNKTYTDQDVIDASGRGGTSGIGVNTYFSGGFIIDLGHKKSRLKLLPSNAIEGQREQSMVLSNEKLPDFEFGVCIPKKLQPLNKEAEIAFFNSIIPIDDAEVTRVLYNIIYGLYPAIKDGDMFDFSKAINEIQQCIWKKSETSIYGSDMQEIINKIFQWGALSVGMSSLGPGLYFTAKDLQKRFPEIELLFPSSYCDFYLTSTNNNPRLLNYD